MKQILRRTLILLGIFIVGVCIFLLASGGKGQEERSYTVMGNSTLPVVTMQAGGVEVNSLTAYTGEMDLGEAEECLTPLPADRRLQVSINTHGNTLTGISYEVRSVDGSNLIERADLDSWDITSAGISAVINIKDLIKKDVEYSLMIMLTTERITQVRYYTRILWSDGLKTDEMMEYVTTFHQATYDSEAAQQFAINWEVDGTGDNESLALVNIHSNFRQLTFRSLSPSEIGRPQYTILEMDPTFGSFRVRYEVTAADENGDYADYYLEEFFCLQWSSLRFYLMSYERTMTQMFTANSSSVTADRLSFGIAGTEDIEMFTSPGGQYIAFIQCGELWMYAPEDGRLTQVFSFRSGEEQDIRLHTDYGLKIMDLTDTGDLSFFLYGHMNRGSHEGENGLSYFKYENNTGSIRELMYVPSTHSCGRLTADLDTLAIKHNNIIYFLINDTVFAMDSEGLEMIRMVEDAQAHNFIVNAAQDTLAWQQGEDPSLASQIQLMYLDTGESHSVTAGGGEYIRACGFVERDFVAGIGRIEDICTVDLERIYPMYAVTITDTAGTEVARYSYSDIVMTGVDVGVGQIVLHRAKESTGYQRIDDDVLMQNDMVIEKTASPIFNEIVEKRLRIRYLKLNGKGKSRYELDLPRQISWYGKEASVQAAADSSTRYYTYVKGRLTGIYDEAGPAIATVYGEMGYVVDSEGHRVWHRTARYPSKQTTAISTAVTPVEEYDRMAGCLNAILRTEGSDADAAVLMANGDSPEEILREHLGCAVLLTGCNMKQIYLFLSRGTPVIALDAEGTPVLLTGYDLGGVATFDPVECTAGKMTHEEASQAFDGENGGRYLSYLKY